MHLVTYNTEKQIEILSKQQIIQGKNKFIHFYAVRLITMVRLASTSGKLPEVLARSIIVIRMITIVIIWYYLLNR